MEPSVARGFFVHAGGHGFFRGIAELARLDNNDVPEAAGRVLRRPLPGQGDVGGGRVLDGLGETGVGYVGSSHRSIKELSDLLDNQSC